MARIRTIKPEFWGSPSMRGATPWARLLFIAMWNWADDTGRGTANVRELAAFAFPDDEDPIAPTVAELPSLLAEVRGRWDVIFYQVGGRRYYAIPSWDEHQRNERRAKSRHPGPEDGEEYDPDPSGQGKRQQQRKLAELPSRSSGTSVRVNGSSGPGTGEQGNRGTGEKSTPNADASGKTVDDWFAEMWKAYPRKIDKQDALKAFRALMKKGTVKPERLVQAALSYAQQNAGVETRFLKHCATWLNKGSYDNEPEQTHLSLVPDAPTSFAAIRDLADGKAVSHLIGRAYVPRPQPPQDPTPAREWERAQARTFIDNNAAAIRAALAEHTRDAG